MNDVDKLAQATKRSFDKVDSQFTKVDSQFAKVDKQFTEVKQEMKTIRQEIKNSERRIINEFKVVAENIHQDVAGANQDKISLIEQKQEGLTWNDYMIPSSDTFHLVFFASPATIV